MVSLFRVAFVIDLYVRLLAFFGGVVAANGGGDLGQVEAAMHVCFLRALQDVDANTASRPLTWPC